MQKAALPFGKAAFCCVRGAAQDIAAPPGRPDPSKPPPEFPAGGGNGGPAWPDDTICIISAFFLLYIKSVQCRFWRACAPPPGVGMGQCSRYQPNSAELTAQVSG